MSDGQLLLKAILAHPDEDTPRLVYADWLDEDGQHERAEFIRVQVALSHPTLGSDGTGDSRERYRLVMREKVLHDPVAKAYLAELPQAFDGFEIDPVLFRQDCEAGGAQMVGLLSRGFCSQVVANWRRWVKHADAILAAHPVREVELTTEPEGRMGWCAELVTTWPKIQFRIPGIGKIMMPRDGTPAVELLDLDDLVSSLPDHAREGM